MRALLAQGVKQTKFGLFFLSAVVSAAALLISLVGAAFGISSLQEKGNEGWQAFF